MTRGPLPIAHRACPAGTSGFGPEHVNEGWELTWIERGRVRFHMGTDVVEGVAGDCICLAPGVQNRPWVDGVSLYQTWLAPSLVTEASEAIGTPNPAGTTRVFRPTATVTLLGRALFAGAWSGAAPGLPNGIADMLAIEIARADRDAPARLSPLDAALRQIHEDYAEPLTVEELARTAGMDRFAFSRAFRKAYGESPYRALIQYRLDRAAEFLQMDTQCSVLEAALRCGFNDPGRFSRAFRQRFGRLPRELRR